MKRTPKSEDDEEERTLLFDVKLFQPACILLQALATDSEEDYHFVHIFDARTWLLAPTKDMRRVTATKREWREVAEALNASYQKR